MYIEFNNEDLDKILKKINKAYGMDDILAVYRVRKDSLSSNKLK